MNVSEIRMAQMLDEIEKKQGPSPRRRNVRDRLFPLGFDAALLVAAKMSEDYATDEPSVAAPQRMPVACTTVVRKVRYGRRVVTQVVHPGGPTAFDNAFAFAALRRLAESEMAYECYEGRPDAVEDAIIAVIDKRIKLDHVPSRMLATMSSRCKRSRGRWAKGKVRKVTGTVPRM